MANLASLLGPPFPYSDTIQIGFDTSPGKVTVTRASRGTGWDERKGYGLSGASLVPKGDPLGTFTLHFEFWDEGDMPAWQTFYDKYFSQALPRSFGGKLGLTILHPVLAQLGMQECVVEDRGPMLKDEFGLWSQEIHFKQYRRPKPAPQPQIANIPGASAPMPTAQTALQRENEALLAELAALPK